MQKLLEGKVAIITGGSSGIGLAMAELFAEEGCKVVITGRTSGRLNDAADKIREKGGEVLAVEGDVTAPGMAQIIMNKTIDQFGSIDILINNAGMGSGQLSIEATDDTFLDNMLSTNLKAPFIFSREAVKYFEKKNRGVIINVSSVNGIRPLTGTAYCASKFGMVGMTRNMALRYAGTGIRINSLCPGPTATMMSEHLEDNNPGIEEGSMHQIVNRFSNRDIPCSAMDVAKAALFLASDLASGCHGQALVVDNGAYL